MWKEVYGFTNYLINEYGLIKNSQNKIISQRYDKKGYIIVSLTKEGKSTTKSVHRLLMETFKPVDNMEDLTVDHINNIKDDNRLENLQWLTNRDNVLKQHQNRTDYVGGNNKIPVQCVETGEIFESSVAAAKCYGIKSSGKIGDAAKNPYKTCAGFHWKYPDTWHGYLKDQHLTE